MRPYLRGFLYGDGRLAPEGYRPGPLDQLFLSPDAVVDHASSDETSVTIIGLCVSSRPDDMSPAHRLLHELSQGEQQFFEAEDFLCGRYAVFVKQAGRLWIMTDATAMRTVFYRHDFSAVASHASMIARGQRTEMPFRNGFPGNGTPFMDVRLLTANTLIELPHGGVRRYWPRAPLTQTSPEEAAKRVMKGAVIALRNAAVGRPVRLSLTAGMDSRAMLAVCLLSGIDFETYTYGRAKDTETDRALAGDLASRIGITHATVTTAPTDPALAGYLGQASYTSHHWSAVAPLRAYFQSLEAVALSANLLEIGRFFYAYLEDPPAPTSPEGMRELHCRHTRLQLREDYGLERFNAEAERHFQNFMEASQFNAVRGILDPLDQFYWEHRMSAWHGPNLLERDFYAQAFIPLNSRRIWEALLGVPEPERRSAAAFHAMIAMADLPELPINPKTWPPDQG